MKKHKVLGTKLYFVCEPVGYEDRSAAGNPADIELEFKGATSVSVTGSGGLDVVALAEISNVNLTVLDVIGSIMQPTLLLFYLYL